MESPMKPSKQFNLCFHKYKSEGKNQPLSAIKAKQTYYPHFLAYKVNKTEVSISNAGLLVVPVIYTECESLTKTMLYRANQRSNHAIQLAIQRSSVIKAKNPSFVIIKRQSHPGQLYSIFQPPIEYHHQKKHNYKQPSFQYSQRDKTTDSTTITILSTATKTSAVSRQTNQLKDFCKPAKAIFTKLAKC